MCVMKIMSMPNKVYDLLVISNGRNNKLWLIFELLLFDDDFLVLYVIEDIIFGYNDILW